MRISYMLEKSQVFELYDIFRFLLAISGAEIQHIGIVKKSGEPEVKDRIIILERYA